MNGKSNLIAFLIAIITTTTILVGSQYTSAIFGQMQVPDSTDTINPLGPMSPTVMSNSTGLSNPSIPMSPTQMSQLNKVFGEKLASELSSECTGTIPSSCIEIEYGSPNIVFHGEYLLFNSTLTDYSPNQAIWKVVDGLKVKGFVIDSVALGGVGSKGNPTFTI
jgi:hypothetical protein